MGHGDRTNIVVAVLLLLSVVTLSRGAGTDLGRAEELYKRTEYRSALNILLPLSPKSAAVYALIGKTYYMDGQYKSSYDLFGKGRRRRFLEFQLLRLVGQSIWSTR